MKPFQVIVLGIFGFFAVVGIIGFATFRGSGSRENIIPVTIWGTIPAETIEIPLGKYFVETDDAIIVEYREIRADVFDTEFVNAIAEARGPDVILLGEESILKHQSKLLHIPFDSYPERMFKDTFVEAGELYVTDEGILGLPLVLDPVVLYWNRDILASSGIAMPPKTWEQLVDFVNRITERDDANNIVRSAIALGTYNNIQHAKKILVMLLQQAGDPIVSREVQTPDGALAVTLGDRFDRSDVPAESVLRFYTEFANPVKPLYSWNRSLPEDLDMFLSGDLALYLGPASQVREITTRNPNLNFDVAQVPQIAQTNDKKTFGNVQALALVRSGQNVNGALQVINTLTEPIFLGIFRDEVLLPPVRRDMLGEPAPDAVMQTLYDAALIADAFLDPNNEETSKIFRRMVDDVTSGRETISAAVVTARTELQELIQ